MGAGGIDEGLLFGSRRAGFPGAEPWFAASGSASVRCSCSGVFLLLRRLLNHERWADNEARSRIPDRGGRVWLVPTSEARFLGLAIRRPTSGLPTFRAPAPVPPTPRRTEKGGRSPIVSPAQATQNPMNGRGATTDLEEGIPKRVIAVGLFLPSDGARFEAAEMARVRAGEGCPFGWPRQRPIGRLQKEGGRHAATVATLGPRFERTSTSMRRVAS